MAQGTGKTRNDYIHGRLQSIREGEGVPRLQQKGDKRTVPSPEGDAGINRPPVQGIDRMAPYKRAFIDFDDLRRLPEIPECKEPFGQFRISTTYQTVRDRLDLYVVMECDTCGRKYALEKAAGRIIRTCSTWCSQVWDKFAKLPTQRCKLYFYRVKVTAEYKDAIKQINPDDPQMIECFYSDMELRVLDELGRGSANRDQLIEAIGEPRTTIYDAIRKLMAKGKVKVNKVQRAELHKKGPGTSVSYFCLVRPIIILQKQCKICGNDKFHVEGPPRDPHTIQCVFCNTIWKLKGGDDPRGSKSKGTI